MRQEGPSSEPPRDCSPAHTWTPDLQPLEMHPNSCCSGQSLEPQSCPALPVPEGHGSSVGVQSMSHVPHGAFWGQACVSMQDSVMVCKCAGRSV